jgi:long-chain acyl-CoA synthetase
VAVVVPDIEYLEKWAAENSLDASDLDALLADEKVQELFTTELNRGQASIKRYERVRDFVLEPDEFTPENGMLTPSLKIKRRAVMAKFGDDIDAMYEADNPLIGRDE